MAHNVWTEKEIQFIKDNWKSMSDQDMSICLKRHTVDSVANKRKRMHLIRQKLKTSFDDVLKEFAKTDYIVLSKPDDYKDAATNNIKYMCPRHMDKGIMLISYGHLKDGRGCYYCGREITESAHRLSRSDNIKSCIELCEKQDFDFVDVQKVNNKYVISYICRHHKEVGIQYMTKGNIKRESVKGCPFCIDKKNMKISKPCKDIEKYLLEHKIKYISEYTFDDCKDILKLPFDFYLYELNIIIEYDGAHHFLPINYNGISDDEAMKSHLLTVKHDKIKNQYCIENNIDLIRISCNDKRKIQVILDEMLNINHK